MSTFDQAEGDPPTAFSRFFARFCDVLDERWFDDPPFGYRGDQYPALHGRNFETVDGDR